MKTLKLTERQLYCVLEEAQYNAKENKGELVRRKILRNDGKIYSNRKYPLRTFEQGLVDTYRDWEIIRTKIEKQLFNLKETK